jgi:cyclophilin family peptidyl-prolyl cis-trans isomerase
VSTQKRQRDARQTRQSAAQAARRRKAERRRLFVAVGVAAFVVLGVTAFVATPGGDDTVETEGSSTTAVRRTPVSLSAVSPGATITGDTACPKTDGTAERVTTFSKPPPTCINPSRTYTAEVRTTKGNFTITLDAQAAPKTVNNFVVLARYKYFEGIAFHRIIPGFVVQGGDPQASGLGGPGYRLEDELPAANSYRVGSVAMANSGPNTNGSQFFIITGPAGQSLQPNFSLFGSVTEGMDVVRAIEAVGTPPTATDPGGQPTEVVTIISITIRES